MLTWFRVDDASRAFRESIRILETPAYTPAIDSGGNFRQLTSGISPIPLRAAVFACSFFADATHAFSGGLNTVVKEYVFVLRFNIF